MPITETFADAVVDVVRHRTDRANGLLIAIDEVQNVDPAELSPIGPAVQEARREAESTGISSIEQQYEVRAGDSLSMIGREFGVEVSSLVSYNEWPEGEDHILLPGDIILIPPGANYVPPCSFCTAG